MKTRTDQFGRVLARSRRNPRAEVVIQTPAERLSPERMAVLGADMSDEASAPPGGTQTTGESPPAGDGDAGGDGDDPFPRHRGGTGWELSDGSKVKGSREDAEKAESEVRASKEGGG